MAMGVGPVSPWSVVVGVVLGGLLLLWALHSSSGWRRASKTGARLPKGSFGWPIIGESLAFARDPPGYSASRVKRYGRIFKSNLMLKPMIVGTTPDFARFVLGNSSLFVSGWPASVAQVVGPKAFAHKDGAQHMSIKKILQKALLPESLRTRVDVLETIVLENMSSWARNGSTLATDGTSKITLDTGMYLLLGVRNGGSTPEGRAALENLITLNKALISPPVNISGSAFNKGLKAKASLRAYFKTLLKTRKTEPNNQGDMLGVLSAAQEDPQARAEVKDLDDETIADNLVFFWFGAYDTTKTTLTWILKFLMDNPEVYRRLKAEQEELFKGRDVSGEEPRVTWEDTKKMVYAHKFFQEVLRTLSIAPFVIKKAAQDTEYQGNLIPKGWGVALMMNYIHVDPAIYSDPESFNPDRFDATPKPYTYLPFSSGPHMCPGIETAKLMSFIFIHHLCTTYTYENAGPDRGVQYDSLPTPIGGYPINIRRRT